MKAARFTTANLAVLFLLVYGCSCSSERSSCGSGLSNSKYSTLTNKLDSKTEYQLAMMLLPKQTIDEELANFLAKLAAQISSTELQTWALDQIETNLPKRNFENVTNIISLPKASWPASLKAFFKNNKISDESANVVVQLDPQPGLCYVNVFFGDIGGCYSALKIGGPSFVYMRNPADPCSKLAKWQEGIYVWVGGQ